MFLALWYYLRGYVTIKAKGFSAERFMNLAAYRGVYLWDVAQDGAGMQMKAASGSMQILEACAEKTGCTIEVLNRGGLPAFLGRFRRRQVWAAGLFCFTAGLYLLSSFIWTVEVEGNERLSKEELLTACEEMGLRPGVRKRTIDTEAVTDGLLAQFLDISWVSVGIKGTDVTIKLAEIIEKAEPVDKQTPCDMVAAADGVIVQITAERGTPRVQAGDVVQKGDVLISSEILIGLEGEEQHTAYTAAEGAVTARIWKRLTEELPLQYEEVVYSGEKKENHSLLFAEKELDLLQPSGEGLWEKEVLSEQPLALGDFQLPLSLKKECWRKYQILEKERTPEETKALLEENLRKKTENLLSPYGKIEDIKIKYEEYADSVHAKAEATLLERIETRKIVEPTETERENLNEF